MNKFIFLVMISTLSACGGGGDVSDASGVGSSTNSTVSSSDSGLNSSGEGSTSTSSTFDSSLFDIALLTTEKNVGNFDSASFE